MINIIDDTKHILSLNSELKIDTDVAMHAQ